MNSSSASPQDLASCLVLQPASDGTLTSVRPDLNQNGRVYGGQILGQAVAAAAAGVGDRPATALQLLFVQGALPDEPIRYAVTPLQDGARFSSRHVRATQRNRVIADAHVSFQVEDSGFEHQSEMPQGIPEPETLATMEEIEMDLARRTGAPVPMQSRPALDVRLIDPERFLFQPADRPAMRYWIRSRHPLPDSASLHAAALAYISDYWLNFASFCMHQPVVGARENVYVASLNHSLWLHEPCRADEWLLFDVESARATRSRGWTCGHVFDRVGRLVASVTQEGLATARRGNN